MNSKRIKSGGHGARLKETRNKYKILVGKRDGKRLIGNLGIEGMLLK
jgi:hypothetical protein